MARLMCVPPDLPPIESVESARLLPPPPAPIIMGCGATCCCWLLLPLRAGTFASDCVRKGCLSASLGEMRCAGLWGLF